MPLTDVEKDTLLKVARAAIESYLREKKIPDIELHYPSFDGSAGAFVSLHKSGGLRGCIGTFASPKPLHKTIADMAVAAATQDPRFSPVKESELNDISLEISVLSPLREIKDPSEVEVGRHGVYLVKGLYRGVLLPQVAVEHGFDRETFLDHTCMKAGLRPGCWRQGSTIFVFEAEIFKENEG